MAKLSPTPAAAGATPAPAATPAVPPPLMTPTEYVRPPEPVKAEAKKREISFGWIALFAAIAAFAVLLYFVNFGRSDDVPGASAPPAPTESIAPTVPGTPQQQADPAPDCSTHTCHFSYANGESNHVRVPVHWSICFDADYWTKLPHLGQQVDGGTENSCPPNEVSAGTCAAAGTEVWFKPDPGYTDSDYYFVREGLKCTGAPEG